MTNKYMYFIANWKMFGDSKTLKSLSNVIKFVKKNKNKRFKIIYCPPYTLISKMSAKFVKSSIEFFTFEFINLSSSPFCLFSE